MRYSGFVAFVTTCVIMGAACPVARAQDEPAAMVQRVSVRGNRVVSATTVLGKIQTQEGQPFSPLILNEDVKRLYRTGYFADVHVRVHELATGVDVVFTVQEKPLYSHVEWEGARVLKTEKLERLLNVQAGEFLNEQKLTEGLQAIRAEYERRGYPNAMVEYTTRTDASTSEATIYILLDEGQRVRIKRIAAEGNRAVSNRRVRKIMKTKRWRWFRSGKYQRATLEEDTQRVAAYYRQRGYQDVQVTTATTLEPDGRHMTITMQVEEGPQYRVSSVQLVGNVLFPETEIHKTLTMMAGEPYNTAGLQQDTRALQGFYFDRGYIFAEILPEPTIDSQTHQVTLTYRIQEHELGYVNRIDIRGNLKTKDVVIRREMRVRPGAPFLGTQLRRSRERLMNLGYFEEVDFDTEPGASDTHKDLIVNVKEQKTGQFSFGGGFSSVDRVLGFVEIEQRNFDWRNWPTFTGAGQRILARAELGTVRKNYQLSFTDPWWFGTPYLFGFDLFNRTLTRNRSLGFGFDQESRGGALRFGHEFSDYVRADIAYRIEDVEISDVPDEASADLKAEEGKNTVSSAGLTLTYDSRDNHFEPTRGMVLLLSGDVAGGALGADQDFYRLVGATSFYVPHFKHFVLEWRTRTGVVEDYGDSSDVPIFERFFGSGTNLIRGFRERRIGPLDPDSNDPIGGETMLISNVDWVFPVAQSIKGSLFLDVGNVWRKVDNYAESVEAGVGFGVRVKTPLGPLRLDLGFPLTEVKDEKRRPRFHFNISRGF